MVAEVKARIFEPFFSTKFKERGLGLAAVSGIVRSHKGAIQVCSSPHKGSTFRVFRPAVPPAVAVPAPPQAAPAPKTDLRGDRIFARGEGLPGRIWASQQPAWITDLETDRNFPRLEAAARRGFRAAFGFPILAGGSVLGVVEFFTRDIQEPDEDLLQMAAATGYQIGEFLERERAQKTLAEREESCRVLTETASDGILAIDAQSRIVFANSAAGRIFGYSREEMLACDLTMLMPEYLRRVHRAAIGQYLETGQRHSSWQAVPLSGRHKDGHEISLEISFAEYEQNNKHIFIGMLRDVTERKRFDEQLQQTAKLESLGLLAGGIAHDFE